MKELQRLGITHTIAPKWYELGIELLDEDQLPRLSIIKSNHMKVSRCCSEMLMFWLNNHHDATWYQLMVALREPGVEMHDAAAVIEAQIIGMFNKYMVLLSCSY